MKVIISQLRKSSADPSLPQFKHASWLSEDYADMAMVTADPGYEIAAVYFVPSTPAADLVLGTLSAEETVKQ